MDKGSTDSTWGKFNSGIVMALVALPLTILFKASGDGISIVIASTAAVTWLVGVLICGLLARHYDGQLAGSAEPSGSEKYKTYRALRTGIETGGRATEVYASQLVAFLTWIDAFFGDSKRAEDAVRPVEPAKWLRKLGFQRVYPMWTVPSYDRCLLLALIYPLAVIFISWVISGEVSKAEQALRLPPTDFLYRVLAGCGVLTLSFSLYKAVKASGRPAWVWVARGTTGYLVFGVAFAVAVGTPVAAAVLGLAIAAAAISGAVSAKIAPGIGAIGGAAVGVIAGASTISGVVASIVAGVVAVAGVTAVAINGRYAAIQFANWLAKIRLIRLSQFYILLTLVYIAICGIYTMYLANTPEWQRTAGPLVLFLPLLTLLNAPFDWFSLGLTRMLLRLGLEKQGWRPYGFALLDALIAVPVVLLLSCVVAVGIQSFDFIALHHGAKAAILPLDAVFEDLQTNPWQWHLSWLYAMLLTTMIPSLINCAIGCFAFFRALPWSTRFLLRRMPERGPVQQQLWVALLLSLQWTLGAVFGCAALVAFIYGIVLHALPAIGIELFAIVRGVVALDIPQRIADLFR
jgi:hypothetical protein